MNVRSGTWKFLRKEEGLGEQKEVEEREGYRGVYS